MRKVRPDAVLKHAPDGVQDAVAQFLIENTLKDAVAWCKKEHKLDVSTRMLSEFRDWYLVTKTLEEAKSMTDQLKIDLKNMPGMDLSGDQISQLGQLMFETQAVKTGDSKLFLGLRRWRLAERNFQLEMKKYRDSVKSSTEKAIDAFMDEIKDNAEAVKLVRKLQALVLQSVEKAS